MMGSGTTGAFPLTPFEVAIACIECAHSNEVVEMYNDDCGGQETVGGSLQLQVLMTDDEAGPNHVIIAFGCAHLQFAHVDHAQFTSSKVAQGTNRMEHSKTTDLPGLTRGDCP
jgi:hypothetical protein